MRGRMAVCPVCGLRNPIARRFAWQRAAIAAGAVLAIVIGWVGYEWWSGRSARGAGFVHLGPPPPSRVPRVLAYGFPAQCSDPAPVYIFDAGSVPDAFIVKLVARGPDANKIAKSLLTKYQLTAPGYDSVRQGFATALSPGQVSRLRCELFVESIQEDPTNRFNRDSAR
jgi:hypothetical protein